MFNMVNLCKFFYVILNTNIYPVNAMSEYFMMKKWVENEYTLLRKWYVF